MNICRKHQPVKMSSIEIDCMAIFLRHGIVSKMYKKNVTPAILGTLRYSHLWLEEDVQGLSITHEMHISLWLAVINEYFGIMQALNDMYMYSWKSQNHNILKYM